MTFLLFPFQFGCLLFIYFCLIVVAGTSDTVSNSGGENRYPCLVLKGMAFSFSHQVWCYLWVCFKWPFLCWRMFSYYTSFAEGFFFFFFIMNECWVLSNAFSVSIEITMWFLSFLLLMWCITLICEYWIPGINHLIMMQGSFYILLNLIHKILLKISN